MAITRDRCDDCHEPFVEGEQVYRYTMLGDAAGFDGVDGGQIFLHAPCAKRVTEIVKHGRKAEKMKLAHELAMSIRGI